jgi:hypothetical protein
MQQLMKITRGLSSPAILIAAVWCVTLISVAVGPIDYPLQPSVPVLVLVAVGVSLFIVGHWAGAWCSRVWLQFRPDLPAPPVSTLNIAVVATSLLGMAGIALIAFDRVVLSGVGNSGYAELLRCAPVLVDFIEIKRTPLLYAGYLTFSFGFASLVLFLLKGEEVRGWASVVCLSRWLCAALFRPHADITRHRSGHSGSPGPDRSGSAAFAARASPSHQDDRCPCAIRRLHQCHVGEQA